MKRIFSTLICILLITFTGMANGEDVIKQNISKIAKELEAKYPGRTKLKVAILDFRTSSNELTPFSKFIQDELAINYKGTRIEIIDQNAINRVVDAYGWNLEMSNDYKHYTALSEQIFKAIGMVPEAFIYGQINDNGPSISLTGYILPNGIKSTNIYSTQVFESNEVTDRLLGKPIRPPKPEPQVVIVEKPVYIEKEVIVEKPVYIEKEVVVEKPVVIEKPTVHPRDPRAAFMGRAGGMDFELLEAKVVGDRVEVELEVVNLKADDHIKYLECRFISPDGIEFNSTHMQSTFRNRDLIEEIAIRGTITFRGDNIQRTQSMSVIEIKVYGAGYDNLLGTLRFRNVPVTR